MRIDGRIPAAAAGAAGSKGRTAAGGEAFRVGNGPGRPGTTGGAAPLATLDAILALQAEDDGAARKRRTAGRGRELLDGLDALKASLLSGRVSPEALARIARGLGGEGSGDPGLDGVLAEIELRAKVELAKLGRYDVA